MFIKNIRFFMNILSIRLSAKGIKNKDLESTDTIVDRKTDSKKSKTTPNQAFLDPAELPPDLMKIVTLWPELPIHIKAAIKALVQTHSTEGTNDGKD